MFVPLNNYIHVEKIELPPNRDAIVSSIVISTGYEYVEYVNEGDTVYFHVWAVSSLADGTLILNAEEIVGVEGIDEENEGEEEH